MYFTLANSGARLYCITWDLNHNYQYHWPSQYGAIIICNYYGLYSKVFLSELPPFVQEKYDRAKTLQRSEELSITRVYAPDSMVYSNDGSRVLVSRNRGGTNEETQVWSTTSKESIYASCVAFVKKQAQKELRRKRVWQLLEQFSWAVRL